MANEPRTWDFSKCPACGSEKRLAESIAAELIKAGRTRETAFAFIQTSFMIPPSPLVSFIAPVLKTAFDVCEECGTVYCVKAELWEVLIQTQDKGTAFGKPFPVA